MSLSELNLWYSNSVLSAVNLKQVQHMRMCVCVYVCTYLNYNFIEEYFYFVSFLLLCLLFLLSWHGILYAFRPFKVHVSRSRCRLNGIFNTCCTTSTSRVTETGFDQRVQADIWKPNGYSERWTKVKGL